MYIRYIYIIYIRYIIYIHIYICIYIYILYYHIHILYIDIDILVQCLTESPWWWRCSPGHLRPWSHWTWRVWSSAARCLRRWKHPQGMPGEFPGGTKSIHRKNVRKIWEDPNWWWRGELKKLSLKMSTSAWTEDDRGAFYACSIVRQS